MSRVFTFEYPFHGLGGIGTKEITLIAEDTDAALIEAVRRINKPRDRGYATAEDVKLVGEWSREEYEALPPAPGPATATGLFEVLSSGFYATGDSNQSDGFGPQYDIGEFATYDEALEASRYKGVQGSDGRVGAYRFLRWTGGAITLQTRIVREHRQNPDRSGYSVGLVVDESLLSDAAAVFTHFE